MRFCARPALLLWALLAGVTIATPAWSQVIVFGGTGQLGARIVRLLLDAGEDVTVFVRPTSDRSGLEGLAVDYVVGDLANDADVGAAFGSGYYRAAIIAVRAPLSATGFYETMSRHVVAHAPMAGVEQIIYHGAVGAGDNMAQHPDVPWASVPGLVERMEDQGRAEKILLGSGIDVTIIRNSRVWPDWKPGTGEAELTEDQTTLTPMTRADLARLTMECLGKTACFGKTYHVRDTSLSWPPPSEAEQVGSCAGAQQATQVNAFFAENNSLPAIAARRLAMPEAVVASALPAEKAVGTTGEVFHDVWAQLDELKHATLLVLKAGHVFEMHGPIPPGTPSTRSRYFNVEFEEVEGVEEEGFSGHLRPDLLQAVYAFVLPGEGGVPVRSVWFYGAADDSDFGVVVEVGDKGVESAERRVFENIWALIERGPRLCA